jgi:hypothetical protein
VHEVMAAMTTSPWPTSKFSPSTGTRAFGASALPNSPARLSANLAADSVSSTRSCGRLGPASDGSTDDRSSSRVSVKVGSATPGSHHRPCSLA